MKADFKFEQRYDKGTEEQWVIINKKSNLYDNYNWFKLSGVDRYNSDQKQEQIEKYFNSQLEIGPVKGSYKIKNEK